MKQYKSTIDTYSLKRIKSSIIKCKLRSSKDAYEYALRFYHDDINIYESFFCIFLNRASNTIGYVKISQGGIVGTIVEPKLILKYVVDSLATAIILVHNHPTGVCKPSNEDINLTKKLKTAVSYVDTFILDHIIISENDFYSFSDNGLI